MKHPVADIEFERQGPIRKLVKTCLINPLANYTPAPIMRAVLRFGKSELAAANWSDPGGWRSMVISYEGNPRQIADKLLVNGGTMSMALRNRKRLGSRVLADLIDATGDHCAHVLCLGAGPGNIIIDAMLAADTQIEATLVDLSSDAFEHGLARAAKCNLSDRVRYIQSDVRDIKPLLEYPPDIVKMLGICEYLSDEQITEIASAVAEVMPPHPSIVFNSISKAHGNDRFFRRVFGLHMIHRTPHQLQDLMASAGFGEFSATAEPLGVYHVIVGRRGDNHPAATATKES